MESQAGVSSILRTETEFETQTQATNSDEKPIAALCAITGKSGLVG